MSNRTLLPVTLLFVAGVGRAILGAPAQQTQTQPESPPAAAPAKSGQGQAQPKPRVIPTGRQLLEEFLLAGAAQGKRDTLEARSASGSDRVASACLPPVGVMVATLPDPVDSHLDWAFDSDYEAIVRAYERAGYVVDRYWLPWSEKLDTLVAIPGGDPSRRLRDVYPGVVLFRRDSTQALATARTVDTASAVRGDTAPPDTTRPTAAARILRRGGCAARTARGVPDLQLVYIVGEVPTGGVHKDALDQALADRDDIVRRAAAPDTLRIVGPSFSGSARSLQVALERWRARDDSTPVQIVTGSATSEDAGAVLRRVSGTSFAATVHSDPGLTAALVWRALCPLRLGDDQVAVLRESGTTYGREVVDRDNPRETLYCNNGRRMHPSRFLVIPFPMNISSLRGEIDQQPRPGAAGETPQSRTRLTLRDPERAGDKPAPTSQLTAPTLEVMLDEIERAVTGHRIRAVGILASDVRDKLFLATELHRRVRDAQLFTFEGNALFLVPENNAALRGMLVVSTYPLTLQSQWWVPGRLSGMRLSFPNDGAVGIHNAVLMQLGHDSLAVDYGFPFIDRGRAPQRPPVWISAVGRNAFVPVTVDTALDGAYVRPMRATPPPRQPWPGIHFFAAVAIVALAAALLVCVRRFLPPWRRGPAVAQVRDDADRMDREVFLDEVRWGSQNFHRAAYATLRALALLSVFIPVAVITVAELTRRSPFHGPGAFGRLLVIAFVALVLAVGAWGAGRLLHASVLRLREVLGLGVRYARGPWPDTAEAAVDRRMWRAEVVLRAVVFAGGAAFFLISLVFTFQVLHLLSTRSISAPLFLARAVALDSGVSPLLPLLLGGAGYAVWCTWHERRINGLRETTPFEAAWHSRGPRPAATPGATALPDDAGRWVREVRMRLFLVIPDPAGAAVLAAIVLLAVTLASQVGHTLEAMVDLRSFDWLLALSITGSLVGTCWAVYRLLTVWRALDRVLGYLAETPLVPAFRRLPPRVGQLTRLTLWRPPSREVVEAVGAAQWRQMRQLYAQSAGEFDQLARARPEVADEVRRMMDEPLPPPSRIPRRLSRGDHDSFLRLNGVLSALWEVEPDQQVVAEIREELKKVPNENTGALFRRSFPSMVRLWMRAAEEFAAVQVVDYIEWVLQQLRTLTVFLFVSLLLTTALLSSYPFQPQSLAKLVFLFVLLATVGALLYVMAALNRDDVLSMIANTDPGRITLDRTFVVNAIAVGVVPLLTLVSSELPDWHLFAFLDPIIHAIAGGG
jgi:hypothetical protein